MQTQRRSQTSFDPRIRGYRFGQILAQANGAAYYAARQDLDTILSKIDANSIDSLAIVPGPFSVRYGPGLSFIGIEAVSPLGNYENGPEFHGRTGLKYQTNGEQWNGRQTFWGGDQDWGFRVGYGHKTGNDYDTGNGDDIPASYKVRDVDASFGLWLTESTKIEIAAIRLDQTDTEFAGQIFDVDFLVTDGYTVRYTMENQTHFDKLVFDAWYNRTRFEGDAQRSGKRRQIPELNDPISDPPPFVGCCRLSFFGFTDVDEMSTGFRTATTWGDSKVDDVQFTLGADLRYQEQELNEFDVFDPTLGGGNANFPIPRSHHSNPGLFADSTVVMTENWTIKAGARVDWVSTDIEGPTEGRSVADLHAVLGNNFDQDFHPFAFYLTSENKLDDHWTFSSGGGYAVRPPTLTELYAVDPFLAILQQGFTQVRGNVNLSAERAWQVDAGLKADYKCWRAGVQGFHSWIYDYITFEARDTTFADNGIENGLGVNFVNTDLATLAGFEAMAEYDWTDMVTPFANMSYVEGRDHRRGDRGVLPGSSEEPLPGIAPLQSRIGFRYHEAADNPRWAIEFAARIVDSQDRIASSLLEQSTPGFTTFELRGYLQASEGLRLTAGVENLGDVRFREHLDLRTGRGVYQPGINGYFGVEWTY